MLRSLPPPFIMDTVPLWFVEQDNMLKALKETHWHTTLANTTYNVGRTTVRECIRKVHSMSGLRCHDIVSCWM